MRKISIKTISVITVFSIMLLLASCGKSEDKNAKKISSKSPWYDAEVTEFEYDFDPGKTLDSVFYFFAGADDKYIAVLTDGLYRQTDYNLPDDSFLTVTLLDRTTKEEVRTIDLYDLVGKNSFPMHALYYDGKLYVYLSVWNPDTNYSYLAEYVFDIGTNELLYKYDLGEKGFGYQAPKQYGFGEYRIEVSRGDFTNNNSYFILRFFSKDGSMREVDIKNSLGGIYDIPVVFAAGDNTLLIPAEAERDFKYFTLDLTTMELTEVNAEDYSWIEPDKINSVFSTSDGKAFISTPQGVSTIDMEKKSFEEYMNYSDSDFNLCYAEGLKISDLSGDSILLCGRFWPDKMFQSEFISNFVIIDLKKADKNPHAGKTLLELYIPENYDRGMSVTVSDAVLKYNETNKDYFIRVTDRYNTDKYMPSIGFNTTDDELDSAYMNAYAQMSYELAMDIMNGEGPDILMNTSNLGQLNNETYLTDLSPYVADIDPVIYYTNIIDRSRTDGKLYQLPISFTIKGIQTDPEYAGSSGVGFTTEEYKSFLYGTLNSKDLIESGQAIYFTTLFNGMSDVFIKDGKVDLSGPEFAELAEYVNTCVQDKKKATDDEDETPAYEEYDSSPGYNSTAYYCNCPGISGYLVKRARIKNGTAILGIPSADGRGPMIGTDISVAISANTTNTDACIDFVRTLLSSEVQSELALSDRFVINRAVLRSVCEQAVDYYNDPEIALNAFDYSVGTNVKLSHKFTNEDIDNLENIIFSCSGVDSPDSAINLILLEEMPAYFTGQKDLSAVITIMQDRMQKVLDERT